VRPTSEKASRGGDISSAQAVGRRRSGGERPAGFASGLGGGQRAPLNLGDADDQIDERDHDDHGDEDELDDRVCRRHRPSRGDDAHPGASVSAREVTLMRTKAPKGRKTDLIAPSQCTTVVARAAGVVDADAADAWHVVAHCGRRANWRCVGRRARCRPVAAARMPPRSARRPPRSR